MSNAMKIRTGQQMDALEKIREKIDALDEKLVMLLEERARLVNAVGQFKFQNHISTKDLDREKSILKKVKAMVAQSSNPNLTGAEMESLFIRVIDFFRETEAANMLKREGLEASKQASINFKNSMHVVLWGFGLLNSSYYMALSRAMPHWKFMVVDPNLKAEAFSNWKELNQAENINLASEIDCRDQDIYILGAPVNINIEIIQRFDFPDKAIVFDLGGRKSEIIKAYDNRFNKSSKFTFIGGHPLVDEKTSGYKNADELTFQNKMFCWVSPVKNLSNKTKSTFNAFALLVGAQPFWMTAKVHDEKLAWTLP